MRRGDNAYIIESSRIIRPVRILNCAGGLYLVKFLDSEWRHPRPSGPTVYHQRGSRRTGKAAPD